MPSINMIAPRRAEKKRLLRDMRRLIFAICIELVAIVAVSGLMAARIYGTKARIGDLDVQLVKLQPIVQKIEYFDQAAQELKPKLELLQNARGQTMQWYNLLDRLSRSVPPKTWYTRVSAVPPAVGAQEVKVNLNGVAASQELVGEAMLRLHSNPDISTVDLHYTQKTMLGIRPAMQFEIAAGMKAAGSSDQEGKGVNKGAVAKS